jgi:anti-sigma regulatory factor (Ser/Thr protein kinase)
MGCRIAALLDLGDIRSGANAVFALDTKGKTSATTLAPVPQAEKKIEISSRAERSGYDECMDRRWELKKPDPSAATAARREFSAHLREHAEPLEHIPSSELIFGELLANAIKYGREPISAELRAGTPYAVLTVEDGGDGFGVDRIPRPEALASGGRGVQLATTFAKSLRVDRTDGGPCRVTVELPVRFKATGGS